MAVTFNRNEKCGEATFTQIFKGEQKTYTVDLYVGNCFLLAVNDYTDTETGEEMEQLCWFFVDEDHMRRCFDTGIFQGHDRLTKIRLNKARCDVGKIVSILVDYLDDLVIETYSEGKQTWRRYKGPQPIIPDLRMREIGEQAVSYINDEMDIHDFLEDRGIDLTDEEKSYFGIYDDEED